MGICNQLGKYGCISQEEGGYSIIAFSGPAIVCTKIEVDMEKIKSFIGLIQSPNMHATTDASSRWAIKLPNIQEATNDQIVTLGRFDQVRYWITGWKDRTCYLRGTKEAKKVMYTGFASLQLALNTTGATFMVYCKKCNYQLVPAYYDPRMAENGSKIKCQIHHSTC